MIAKWPKEVAFMANIAARCPFLELGRRTFGFVLPFSQIPKPYRGNYP